MSKIIVTPSSPTVGGNDDVTGEQDLITSSRGPDDNCNRQIGTGLAAPSAQQGGVVSPPKPLKDYLLGQFPKSSKTSDLSAWLSSVVTQCRETEDSNLDVLSILHTLFSHHNDQLRGKFQENDTRFLSELVPRITLVLQDAADNISLENLTKALGGIGLIPDSFLTDQFKEFLLNKILSYTVEDLIKLKPKRLAAIIFGIRNFDITEASEPLIKRVLELVRKALSIQAHQGQTKFTSYEAEILSAGIQNFHKICPQELLEKISISLEKAESKSNQKNIKDRAAQVVAHLQGYKSTPHTTGILNKAASILQKTELTEISNSLLSQALIGFAAHADKSGKIRNAAFRKILQSKIKKIRFSASHSNMNARAVIFACRLYKMRTGDSQHESAIDGLKTFINSSLDRKITSEFNIENKVKNTINKQLNRDVEFKRGIYLLDCIEADLYLDDPRKLNIEFDGPLHSTAASRVRVRLRDELLRHNGIGVIRISLQDYTKDPSKTLDKFKNELAQFLQGSK